MPVKYIHEEHLHTLLDASFMYLRFETSKLCELCASTLNLGLVVPLAFLGDPEGIINVQNGAYKSPLLKNKTRINM